MSSIPNSLSRSFPRISLEQGRLRSGLQPGWSRAEHEAGKTMRDRFSLQMWGTDDNGARVNKEDSFLSGDVFHDRPGAPTDNGWRRDFSIGLVDRDRKRNLSVRVEKGSESPAELIISNQGEKGTGTLRIALDGATSPEGQPTVLGGPDNRVVFVQNDVNDQTGARRTRVGVGIWEPDATWYETSNGVLRLSE